MMASLRAELIRLGRWRTTWVLGGIWLLLNLLFGYGLPYLGYRDADGGVFAGAAGDSSAGLLAGMMPENAPATMVMGWSSLGAPLLLILAASAVASGYTWGTWKTVLTTGPRRSAVLAGTVGSLLLIVVALALVTLGLDLLVSTAVAAAEGQHLVWPAFADVIRGLGAALLVGAMWSMAGVLLGTVTRSPALAVGLGLVWALVVEGLVRGVSTLVEPLEAVAKILPGTAATSLASAAGGQAPVESDLISLLGGGAAAALLSAYAVTFTVAAVMLMNRRDVAG